jgi:hypothetical protein
MDTSLRIGKNTKQLAVAILADAGYEMEKRSN